MHNEKALKRERVGKKQTMLETTKKKRKRIGYGIGCAETSILGMELKI